MVFCSACGKEIQDRRSPCPRCGFLQPGVLGDEDAAGQIIHRLAKKHLVLFLRQFDFGIQVYYWKEKGGQVVPDRQQRLSFGTGDSLVGRTEFLSQQFARVPGLERMELQLSVLKLGKPFLETAVSLPVPEGELLQQAGLELSESLQLRLKLKNDRCQTQSEPLTLE